MTLEPAVATSKSRSQKTDTLASSGDYPEVREEIKYLFGAEKLTSLLFSCPESVNQILRVGASANRHRLLVLCDRNALQARQINLDAIVHLAKRGECTMVPVVSKDRDVMLGGEFDLTEQSQFKILGSSQDTYNFGDILFSTGYDNNVRGWSFQVGPANCMLGKLVASWKENLSRARELWCKRLQIDAGRRRPR
jgi:hypothetical protein